MPDYEPIRTTAERLGKSRETIRLWALRGYFPGADRPDIPGSEWMIPAGSKPVFRTEKAARRTVRRTR